MTRKRTRGPRAPELGALGQAIERARRKAKLSSASKAFVSERASIQPPSRGLSEAKANPTYLTLIALAVGLGTTVSKLSATAERICAQSRASEKET